MVPALGEHALFLGENGEGKTYLASGLVQEASQSYPFVIFDTKGEDRFDPYVDTDDWLEVRERLRNGRPRTVYRPQGVNLEPELLDAKIHELYDSGYTGAIYLDELEHVAPNAVALPGLRYALVSGRRRKIRGADGEPRIAKLSVWMGAHRPRYIPNYCKNEPKSYFVFGLSEEDLKTMRPYLHDTPLTRPPRHHFWYYRKGDMEAARLMPPVKLRGGD